MESWGLCWVEVRFWDVEGEGMRMVLLGGGGGGGGIWWVGFGGGMGE